MVRQARFAGAFTFQYSPRPGTPAADMADQVPHEIVQRRYERLVAEQEEIGTAGNAALVGSSVEVLVAAGEGRKDALTGRMSGRARDGRLVHLSVAGGSAPAGVGAPDVRPGDVVVTRVTAAAPHYLVADGSLLSHRRTRAGDRWEQERSSAHEADRPARRVPVSLGMPRATGRQPGAAVASE